MSDCAEYWKIDFDTPTFEADIEALWKQVEPLYKELHAYVRMKLNAKYGDDVVKSDGPIPAHLLGQYLALQFCQQIVRLMIVYIFFNLENGSIVGGGRMQIYVELTFTKLLI